MSGTAKPAPTLRIGVDMGGTKIEAAVLDQSGGIVIRRRVPSPREDYDATVRTVSDLVKAVESEAGSAGTVGVAIPGTISPASGLVKGANSTWLIGHALDQDLAAALDRPVKLANDANCFALSEAVDGAAAGVEVVFGVIIGTGAGAGITVHGRVLEGANSIAGEWGHNQLPWPDESEWPGPACYCGQRGCIETFVSGTGMARDHLEVTGVELTAEEIVAAAEQGDEEANSTLIRYDYRLARALTSVINLIDPDVVVFGGGLSNLARIYENIPPLIPKHAFSDEITTRFVPNMHGDSSGVRGAAWLWRKD